MVRREACECWLVLLAKHKVCVSQARCSLYAGLLAWAVRKCASLTQPLFSDDWPGNNIQCKQSQACVVIIVSNQEHTPAKLPVQHGMCYSATKQATTGPSMHASCTLDARPQAGATQHVNNSQALYRADVCKAMPGLSYAGSTPRCPLGAKSNRACSCGKQRCGCDSCDVPRQVKTQA